MQPESNLLPLILIGGIFVVAYYIGKQPARYSRRGDDFLWGMLVADSLHDHHGYGYGYSDEIW